MFEFHWSLKDNTVAKYEILETEILSRLDPTLRNQSITIARYFPERGQWMIIDPHAISHKKAKNAQPNLKLEPYKLGDMTVLGILPGEHRKSQDFDSEYEQIKRIKLDEEQVQKRANRERNRADNDRNQQNGSSGRRKSPQQTMRITVDDFDS